MSSADLTVDGPLPDEARNFSLFIGGPLFQLLRRAHLVDDALRLVKRRMVLAMAVTWLPLLAFSALQGHLWGDGTALPFGRDIECHVRFLLVVPLLIWAEPFVFVRMRSWVAQFYERNLIPLADRPRFEAAVASALRLRNSVLAEVLLIALVYGVGVLVVWRHFVAFHASSWYAIVGAGEPKLTLAGLWFVWLSIPLLQFLLCRWYFRLFIWARFLWQVSRIRLELLATHPDRAGGLGFLNGSLRAFMPVVLAHGALAAGQIANKILYAGEKLPEFILEIFFVAVFLVCLFVAPLMVFAPQVTETRRRGLRQYGVLAQGYVRAFDNKWLRGGAPADEPLLGSGDVQSLADLGNSFGVIESMRLTPVSKLAVVELVAGFLAPIAPLALTLMPPEKLIQSLIGLVL